MTPQLKHSLLLQVLVTSPRGSQLPVSLAPGDYTLFWSPLASLSLINKNLKKPKTKQQTKPSKKQKRQNLFLQERSEQSPPQSLQILHSVKLSMAASLPYGILWLPCLMVFFYWANPGSSQPALCLRNSPQYCPPVWTTTRAPSVALPRPCPPYSHSRAIPGQYLLVWSAF